MSDRERGTCLTCEASGILISPKGNLWSHEPGSTRIMGKRSTCPGAGFPPAESHRCAAQHLHRTRFTNPEIGRCREPFGHRGLHSSGWDQWAGDGS